MVKALIFDVDGTIAETEELHRMSFNESFKEFNLNWFWDKPIYKRLINIGGGKERIEHYIRRAWPEMLEYKNLNKYINSIHKVKSEIYEDYINESKVEFRPGVFRLMEELKKIIRVLGKKLEGCPHDRIIVLDGATGQNAHSQMDEFSKAIDISGVIVTKLDGSAKGGIVVSLADRFGLPIHSVGVGERLEDLDRFDAKEYSRAIVGLDNN